MNNEVTGNNEVVRGVGGPGKKRRELIKKGGYWLGVMRGGVVTW